MATTYMQQVSWRWPTPASPPDISRNSTPKDPWQSSVSTDRSETPRNPWPSRNSPPSTSRSATPLAPRPVRPPVEPPRTPFSAYMPMSPAPSEYSSTSSFAQRNRGLPSPAELMQETLTPSVIADMKLSVLLPGLLSKLGWDRPTNNLCYVWALKNPRTALLLYMTGNLSSWTVAAIFNPLSDDMLPFTRQDIECIVEMERVEAVLNAQKKVLIGKVSLGEHVEMKDWEGLPFERIDVIKARRDGGETVVDKVRWLAEGNGEAYARKTIVCSQRAHRARLESEVRSFKKLRHPNISTVALSYAQGNLFGIIMAPLATCNMAEYLRLPTDTVRPDLLRSWMRDLASGLEYIHANDMRHREIRPAKILVNGDQILYSCFGISRDPSAMENNANPSTRKLNDPSYIYAAPEAISRNKRLRSADIFSLGCVFLEMMTLAKGRSVDSFRNFRASNGDESFHANLGAVMSWIRELRSLSRGISQAVQTADSTALARIESMLQPEHLKRPKAASLTPAFANIWPAETSLHPKMGQLSQLYEQRWGDRSSIHSFFD